MNRPLKIAFLLPSNDISGGLFVAYRHAHFLASRGHDVTVAFLSDAKGLTITSYPDFLLPVRHLQELATSGEKFDVVLSGWWECYHAMFRLRAERYLHFIQGDDREAIRATCGGYFADEPFIDLAFTDPRVGYLTVARWLQKRLTGDADIAVAYTPNGIDETLFRPDVAPLARRTTRPRVLIEGAGGLAFKRIDFAFDVARQIEGIDVWHVSSDGVLKDHWRADRSFSRLPIREMPAIYASCDVLLKLSVVEGFFGPPLEMMACGGTAVVGRVKGHDEYIVDGLNALSVPLDDGAAAVAALRHVVSDANLRRRLSENGLRTAREFAWERQCPKFEQGLLDLLERIPLWSYRDRASQLAQERLRNQVSACERELARQINSQPSSPQVIHAPQRISARAKAKTLAKKILRTVPWADQVARRIYFGPAAPTPAPALPAVAQPVEPEYSIPEPRLLAFTTRPNPAMIERLGPVVFAGQPEYFRATYYDAVRTGQHFEFPVTSADPSRLRDLPAFARSFGARTCIVFRPEWLSFSPGVVEKLQDNGVRVVGYSTEPIPTTSTQHTHPDLTLRLDSLKKARPLPLDLFVHYDPASESFLRKLGFTRLISHPLPVSEALFYPEDVVPEFDACFLGRSTAHREWLLGPLKSRLNLVHVAHGLVDENARSLMNRSRLVLNLHNEPYLNFENRIVQALRCRRPLVSEPLTGNFLVAGLDYREIRTPNELLSTVLELLRENTPQEPTVDLSRFTVASFLAQVATALDRLQQTHSRHAA